MVNSNHKIDNKIIQFFENDNPERLQENLPRVSKKPKLNAKVWISVDNQSRYRLEYNDDELYNEYFIGYYTRDKINNVECLIQDIKVLERDEEMEVRV